MIGPEWLAVAGAVVTLAAVGFGWFARGRVASADADREDAEDEVWNLRLAAVAAQRDAWQRALEDLERAIEERGRDEAGFLAQAQARRDLLARPGGDLLGRVLAGRDRTAPGGPAGAPPGAEAPGRASGG